MPSSLIPLPRRVDLDGGRFLLGPDAGLRGVPEVIAARLRERTGLVLDGSGSPFVEYVVEPDELPGSYRLQLGADGVRATAGDAAGLFYAGCTLEQLLTQDGDGWWLPTGVIEDAPRFGYRGVMLDVARHFFGVATVKRLIDRMARLKLNMLHLHLTDDQGWRIEIVSLPELTAKASGSEAGGGPGGYYTQADYAELVEYAAARQVTIVPEVDLPGHTHAIGLAYPEVAEPPVINDVTRETFHDGVVPVAGMPFTGFGVGFSSVRIDHEPTYAFLADVLGELAALTPGPYLHVGGDECLGTEPTAYAAFLRRITGLVAGLGKTPVTWHEAGAVSGLAPGTVGQYWHFLTPGEVAADCARRLVAAGSQLVLSPSDAAYLDMRHPGEESGQDWAGATSLQDSYDWEPTDILQGVGEPEILGIEAALWTEMVSSPAQIDALLFPRLAAIAEVAWSAPAGTSGRTWPEFRDRVAGLAPGWRADGVGFTELPEVDWVGEAGS